MTEIEKLKADLNTVDEIVDTLPDDLHRALIILSMCVDQYAAEHGMDNTQVWTTIYHAALHTRKTVGEYPRRLRE